MEATVASVLSKVAKRLAASLRDRSSYLRNYKSNFEILDHKVELLKDARNEVQHKVDDALKNIEEIRQEVKEWQDKVELIIYEAEKLIRSKENNRCLKGLCPNLMARHKHSKEASRKVDVILRFLKEEERFCSVSCSAIPEDVQPRSFNEYEALESRNSTLKNILDGFNDANIHMVGVSGMGGIGKTMLVQEVSRQVEKHKFFEEVVCPILETLELIEINIEEIWDSHLPRMFSSYQNLSHLILSSCDRLKYVFSFSIVRSLEQLQHLEISECIVLKEIVAKSEEVEPANFVFPRVTFLKLWHLRELKTFYSGMHIAVWPVLKKLEIGECDNVEVFGPESLNLPENDEGHLDISRSQCLFLVGKINPKLEKLRLGGKNITMMWRDQFAKDHFCGIKILKLENDESTSIPFRILQTFKTLEKLDLYMNSYEGIFSCEEDEEYDGTPLQIKVLQMKSLFNMKTMWNQDFQLGWVLQNLEILEVNDCHKLINVVPSSSSFQNLTSLEVYRCNGLINLTTCSTAKSFGRLTEMKIQKCKLLKEIVASEDDAVKDEIVFSKLKLLSLEYLGSLRSFCLGNCALIFPSLEQLIVENCPEMKTFCEGVLYTPKLQKVNRNFWDKNEWHWEGDLNSTIQQLHLHEQQQILELSNPNLEEVALGGTNLTTMFGHENESGLMASEPAVISEVQSKKFPDADTTSPSPLHRFSTEIVSEDEMTGSGSPQTDTLPEDESKIQDIMGTTFDLKESMQSIHNMELETVPSPTEREGWMKPVPNESVNKPVERVGVKSIEVNMLKIFKHMSDAAVTKIGVHGIGGIGKTTLLKALISHPKTKGMFDVIMLVTVSRYWTTRKIQNEVIRQLSFSHEDSETDSQVAEKLFQVLNGKKFLLLLDDVWGKVDLKKVGIPDPSSKNSCKILMASRKLDAFRDMGAIREIEVGTVSWQEAWELFHEQVGGIIDLPGIRPFARAIVEGCGGLPLLIIVTGRALTKQNDVSVWKLAAKEFSLPTTSGVYHNEYVIKLLKFSFYQLKDHDIKSCFIHCCLFPEDREINILEFVKYCIWEGIITGSWADAHRRGYEIIDVLIRTSMLQSTEGGDSITIHDSLRDLALGILSSAAEDRKDLLRAEGSKFLLKAYSGLMEPPLNVSTLFSKSLESSESSRSFMSEGNQFLLRAGASLKQSPLEEEWKQAKMIFLMDNNLCSLPEKPSCPDLLTLFLQRNYQLRVISPSFFDCMTSLQVLNLSNTRINSLPESLFTLKNLLILVLRDCERLVMLPHEVRSLQCLEVLDLRGTEINNLPDGIGELESLRHLEVSFYGSIDDSGYDKLPDSLISSGIISRLYALETLSIFVSPGDERWYEDVKYLKIEISNLMNLRYLCFHFPEIEHVKVFLEESIPWKDQSITKFKLVVGRDVKSFASRVPARVVYDYNQEDQCLRIVNGEKKPNEVLQILARSTAFYLDHHLDIESLSDFGVSNINGLKFCIISECPNIKEIVNTEEHKAAVFPSLETLSINHLWNLDCIWVGTLPEGSFAELRILSLRACLNLKYVFRSSMFQSLSNLKELSVEDCPAIEEIIGPGKITDSDCILLPSLKRLTLHYLPGLMNIWSCCWPSLEYISICGCPRLKKIGMDSRLEHSVIEIKAEKSWWDELQWEDTLLRSHLETRFTRVCEDNV